MHCSFTGSDRTAHRDDFIGAFNHPGFLGDGLTFKYFYTDLLKCTQTRDLDLIHCQSTIITAVAAHQIIDLFSK